ncbi:MAG: hypothetical protein ABMA64_23060 [Myxococcota bacterium]
MWGLHLVRTASAACERGDPRALQEALEAADRALAVLDVPAFDVAVERALTELPCVEAPIDPALAAAVHEVVGLRAFGRRDPSAAAAFAAARRTDPSRPPPSERFPAVGEAWGALSVGDVPTEPLPAPAEGWLAVDGARATERPAGLPVVLQWFHADGTVGGAAYVWAGGAADLYPAAPSVEPPERRGRTALAWTTAAAGGVAVTTWGLSLAGRARYLDLDRPVPDAELDGLRARTNGLALTSGGAAAVCLASGIALAVAW